MTLSQISQTHKTPDKNANLPIAEICIVLIKSHITTHQTVENQAKSSQIVSPKSFPQTTRDFQSLCLNLNPVPDSSYPITHPTTQQTPTRKKKNKIFAFFLSSFFRSLSVLFCARCTMQHKPNTTAQTQRTYTPLTLGLLFLLSKLWNLSLDHFRCSLNVNVLFALELLETETENSCTTAALRVS